VCVCVIWTLLSRIAYPSRLRLLSRVVKTPAFWRHNEKIGRGGSPVPRHLLKVLAELVIELCNTVCFKYLQFLIVKYAVSPQHILFPRTRHFVATWALTYIHTNISQRHICQISLIMPCSGQNISYSELCFCYSCRILRISNIFVLFLCA
jgi:hypothetical protein